MILEDNTFYYRIWVQDPPRFNTIPDFRQPSTSPISVDLKTQ